MRRMLIIGNHFPGLRSIEWSNWPSENILDYQALLLDCQASSFTPENPELRKVLQQFVGHGHTLFVILPRVKQTTELNFLPGLTLRVHPQHGETMRIKNDHGIFKKYISVLSGHELYFEAFMYPLPRPLSINDVVDNVDRPICGAIENIVLLHPPGHGNLAKALQIIVEIFGPEFEEPQVGPAPSWAADIVSRIPGVAEARQRLSEIEQKIQGLETERQSQEAKLKSLCEWGQLIWVTGIPFQRLVQNAFAFVGFDIEPRPETGHGEDFVARHKDFAFLVEATGSTGGITIEKGRQLMHWVTDSDVPNCHGLLVANAFSTEDPGNRPPTPNHHIFSPDLERFAEKFGFSLLDNQELFRTVCAKLAGTPFPMESICRELSGEGVIRFSCP
jgi:hypothetical protein